MSNSVREGLQKLCETRRRLFATHGGYPANSTYVLNIVAGDGWLPIVLFGAGPSPARWEQMFDPSWSVVPPAEPLYDGKVSLGMAVEGNGGASTGSVGWNVMFNGHDAMVTSRHVVVSDFSSTNPPVEASVFSNPTGSAAIVWSPIMESTTPATFDIAICEYIHGEGRRKSNCGGTAGYPTTFATDLNPGADTFQFAGKTSGCGYGKLVAVADVQVDYTAYKGGFIWLQNQLIFDFAVAEGDSGSLVKRTSDNAVVGLNCAKSKKHGFAIANPLFLIDWDVTPGGPTELPTVTPRRTVPAGMSRWKAPQQIIECGEEVRAFNAPTNETREDAIARFEWVAARAK